jgi:ABC-type branched-subunit amino acid transport system ATPase component
VLRSVHIENFRALREFRMSGLGRVNLLVGTNNCGKTSILEAIHILATGDGRQLFAAVGRRGETSDGAPDITHLVHGHRLREGLLFRIGGDDDGTPLLVSVSLESSSASADARPRGALARLSTPDEEPLRVQWSRGDEEVTFALPLVRNGSVWSHDPTSEVEEDAPAVQFVATSGLAYDDVVRMLDAAVLTPDEDVILEALHSIDPTIGRLATVGSRYAQEGGRTGIMMMVAGQRLPIGSMGDGVWRLLGLACALVRARGQILLVDEIDTGLHYSVLTKMWRLVFETAKRLDVQVFATTHSRDCYEALGEIAVADRNEISLQRIERGKAEAVAYREGVLRQAAERGLEVR